MNWLDINRKTYKPVAWSLAVVLLISCSPFFSMGGNAAYLILGSTGIYFLFFANCLARRQARLSNRNLNYFIISFMLLLYLFFPIRQYDRIVVAAVWLLVFLTVLMLDTVILLMAARYFADIIFVIALLALLVFAVKLIGVDLPFYPYETGATGSKSLFFIYPGTAVLQGQEYTVFGRSLFRVSGIFSEPGHFGMISAIVLFMNPEILSKRKRTVITIAALLTLSMGFYVLFAGLCMYRFRFSQKQVVGVVVLALVGFIAISAMPADFMDRFFLNKMSSNQDVLDARTSAEFSRFYDHYTRYDINLFGGGRTITENFEVTSSDYRSFLLKYGWVGIALYLVWFFVMTYGRKKQFVLLSFFFFAVVFVHRSWLVDYLIFLFAVYFIPISYELAILPKNSTRTDPQDEHLQWSPG
ncbi:hypothetical protein [Chitinophaga varians]|uniref:hypothetical protein n=1 Tax=Chitinophaga varians TaxID=2202339 RepID=UPI00165F45CD|nr:hypothetical protein [Chitinophaga varians]MBC9908886.1 hypothetical protein [Chitinophaga varians]